MLNRQLKYFKAVEAMHSQSKTPELRLQNPSTFEWMLVEHLINTPLPLLNAYHKSEVLGQWYLSDTLDRLTFTGCKLQKIRSGSGPWELPSG